MNKTDAYNEFDPTQAQGGCNRVEFDIETLTWKEQNVPTPADPCTEVKAQLTQTQTDLAQATADKADVEAKLAEMQVKLDKCEENNCYEITILSLGDEVIFNGTSCDAFLSLGDDGGAVQN